MDFHGIAGGSVPQITPAPITPGLTSHPSRPLFSSGLDVQSEPLGHDQIDYSLTPFGSGAQLPGQSPVDLAAQVIISVTKGQDTKIAAAAADSSAVAQAAASVSAAADPSEVLAEEVAVADYEQTGVVPSQWQLSQQVSADIVAAPDPTVQAQALAQSAPQAAVAVQAIVQNPTQLPVTQVPVQMPVLTSEQAQAVAQNPNQVPVTQVFGQVPVLANEQAQAIVLNPNQVPVPQAPGQMPVLTSEQAQARAQNPNRVPVTQVSGQTPVLTSEQAHAILQNPNQVPVTQVPGQIPVLAGEQTHAILQNPNQALLTPNEHTQVFSQAASPRQAQAQVNAHATSNNAGFVSTNIQANSETPNRPAEQIFHGSAFPGQANPQTLAQQAQPNSHVFAKAISQENVPRSDIAAEFETEVIDPTLQFERALQSSAPKLVSNWNNTLPNPVSQARANSDNLIDESNVHEVYDHEDESLFDDLNVSLENLTVALSEEEIARGSSLPLNQNATVSIQLGNEIQNAGKSQQQQRQFLPSLQNTVQRANAGADANVASKQNPGTKQPVNANANANVNANSANTLFTGKNNNAPDLKNGNVAGNAQITAQSRMLDINGLPINSSSIRQTTFAAGSSSESVDLESEELQEPQETLQQQAATARIIGAQQNMLPKNMGNVPTDATEVVNVIEDEQMQLQGRLPDRNIQGQPQIQQPGQAMSQTMKNSIATAADLMASIHQKDPQSVGGPYYGAEPNFKLQKKKNSGMNQESQDDEQRRNRRNRGWDALAQSRAEREREKQERIDEALAKAEEAKAKKANAEKNNPGAKKTPRGKIPLSSIKPVPPSNPRPKWQ